MRPLPLKKSFVIALVSAGLVSSACVKSNPPGVGLVKVDTAAVFGIEKVENTPPGFTPQVVEQQGDEAIPVALPDLPKFSIGGGTAQKRIVNIEKCPEADTRKVFPKDSATVQVQGLPTEGLYQWKRDQVIVKNVLVKPPLRLLPFALESRFIRRVTRSTDPALRDHQFSFEMVAPSIGDIRNFDITTFIVNTNPTLLVNERVESRTVGVVPVAGQDVRVSSPQDTGGIFISRIETQDAKGARLASFTPLRPMLILPLDEAIVRSGQTFSSIGIDPVSTSVLRNDGIVNRTSRIDACGEVVEGYSVTLNQSFTDDLNDEQTDLEKYATRMKTRTIDYTFATQYGALPIAESIAIGDVQEDNIALAGRWTLGGLTPAKLPDSAK